ncbi:Nudix hydrolase 2 [Linum perenne]
MSSASSEVAIEEHHHVSGVKEIELLKAKEDWFGGLTVVINEHMEAVDFVPQLRYSISKWKAQGKKGLWIKLSISHSNLVDSVVKEGFRFHHAESDYVMLVRWLPDDAPDTLPPNASHRVGIGAFVINESKEVLVVMERSGGFRDTKYWKLPTGVVEEGEDICAAAVREVKEETGIDVEFVEILAFRQSHRCFFSKSDLFFVCMMRPVSSIMITIQASEIEASKLPPPPNQAPPNHGFFSMYIRNRANEAAGIGGSIRNLGRSRRAAAVASRGLDSTVIETFPTMIYSAVKGIKIGKDDLECIDAWLSCLPSEFDSAARRFKFDSAAAESTRFRVGEDDDDDSV